jgi:uncharacterized membrane protein YbjE (DUF340 family)
MNKIIIASFSGSLLGLTATLDWPIRDILDLVLPLLVFSIGVSLSKTDLQKIFKTQYKLMVFPFVSLFGAFLASILVAKLFDLDVKNSVLAGSAMGFYSVPAAIASAKVSTLSGTIVLLTNLLREMLTIITAPLLSKLSNKYSLIATGGATTMDVSLPIIRKVAGEDLVPLALINGIILTIIVPTVITLLTAI